MHVSINNTSGLAGIAYWINQFYNLPNDQKIEKSHPIVSKVKEMIDKEYADGRCSVMGDEELDNMILSIDKQFRKKLLVFVK